MLVLALAAYTLAEPQKCKAGCHGSTNKIFRYEDGTTYTYNVEGTTTTSLTGAKGEATKLTLKATAELSAQPDCAHFIKLSGVSVTGPDGKKYDSLKELEKYPLRYNFHDGHIDSEVCAVEGDSQTALNVKRAIASLFQVAASQSFGSTVYHEVDVFGACPTEFTFTKDGDTLIVRKDRNLNRCAYREDFVSDILSVPYAGGSPLQNTPILASSMQVTQKIKNGVLSSAECSEEYFHRPLSNRDAGAKTVVETKITLASQKKQAPANSNVNSHRSIIFEAPHITSVPGNADAIAKTVHKAHESMKTTVGENSAREFSNVVQVLRQSTKADILKAYESIHHKGMFVDALLRAGTGDAVEAAVELVKKNDIKDLKAKTWYMSLAFVRHATPSSLAAVASLIDANSPRGLFLGAGALAGRFCREHDCDNKAEFNTLVSKLSIPLGSTCKPTDKDSENKIIASLKALHNIHDLNDKAADIVSVCASTASLPARIRVAALEAIHGDACIPKLRQTALKILKNVEEDSEIRIKAYLALVDCPNGEVANALKDLIDNEPSNQVGAFIVSHLRNLRASANPDKELAKTHLGNVKPRKRFPNDLRKFSRNFEISTLVDLINVGASVESNVIFSQRSYLPRSASLNLTTDIFGHSVNLLELGIRAENVDRVLEHIFGPKGYVRSNDVKSMYHEGKDRFVSLIEKVSQRFAKTTRGKRAVSRDQINAVSKKVNLGPEELDAELDIDLSVRTFGLENVWLNYHGGRQVTPDSIIDKIFDGLDAGIGKAKSFDHDIRTHARFLDTELTYPTSLGFPLKLSVTGNSAIHLKAEGQIDIHSIMKDPKNAEAKIHITPSAAIEINGLMIVDAIAVQSGLKLAATLYTATGSDITVKMLDGAGIDIKFGLPLPKQDIITIKSEIFNFKQEKGQVEVAKPLSFNSKRRDFTGCFDQLSPVIGLTLCTEVGFPSENPSFSTALFPLNGPAKLSVQIEKDEDGMTGYHFMAHYNKKVPQKRSFEIVLDTPGSKTNRKLALTMEGSTNPDYAVKVALASPWKKLSVEGQLLDNAKSHMLVGKLINDKAEYSVKVGLEITGSPDSQTYAPVLEYNAPGRKEALTGSEGKKQPVHIEGTVTIEKKGDSYRKYKFNAVTLTTPMGKFGIDGSIVKDKDLIAHDVKLTQDKNNLALNTKLQKLGENNYAAHIEAVPAQFPDFSFAIDWNYKRGANQLENNLVVAHGANLKAAESRVTLNQDFKYKIENMNSFDVSTKQKLTYPILGIDAKFEGGATRKSVNYELTAKYDTKKLESKLSAKANTKAIGDYEANFMAKINDKGVVVSSKRDKPSPDKSKLHHLVELTPGGKYELTSDVTYNFEKNNIKYQGEHLLKLHQQPDIKVSTGLTYKPGNLDSSCTVTFGDAKYLDTSAKLDRSSGSPSGSFKVLIKDIVDSHGELKYAAGKGSASFLIDIPKVQRKIKGSGQLTVAGSNHKASADLLWNADKDPKQKLHIETDTDFTAQSLKSKNTIIIMDWKTLVNLKRDVQGTPRDGTVKTEVDVTIPSGRKLSARFNREAHIKAPGETSTGDMELQLEDIKGDAKRTLSVKSKGSGDMRGTFDHAGEFNYQSPSGKDLHASFVTSRAKSADDKWTYKGKVNAKGSYLPQAMLIEVDTEASKNQVTYKVKGNCPFSPFAYDVQGKLITGLDGSANRHFDTIVDVKLPFEILKTIKVKTDWTLSAQEGSPCQVGAKQLMELFEKMKAAKGLKLASTLSMLAPGLVPSCELKARNELNWNDKTMKLDAAMKADLRRGTAKAILTLPEDKPRSVLANWVQELDQEQPKVTSSVALSWDSNKEAKVDLKVEGLKDLNDIKAKLTATTNVNEKHKFEAEVVNKIKNEHAVNVDVRLAMDDKKIRLGVDVDHDEKHPKIDLKLEHAAGTSRFSMKTDKKSDKEFKSEGNVEWASQGGGKLDWGLDCKIDTVDSFAIKGHVNSEKLKLNNYQLEVANDPGQGDKKKITFSCKTADQNILSGSTNYAFKEEGKVWTMEGSGSVQVKNEARSSHFKYTQTQLNLAEDKEVGVEHKLNVDFGGKENLKLERKVTNRRQRFVNIFCDKEKKCTHVEFDNHIKVADFVEFNRELKVIVDLKSIGLPHDYNLKATNLRKGRIFDNEVEMNFNSGEKTTISYKVYAHETSAGVILNLPQRTIEALATLDLPNSKKEGSFKGELALWLDKKRQPNLKSSLLLVGDVSRSQDGASISGGAHFTHPDVKELAVTGRLSVGGPQNLLDANLDLDVFADKKQKVVLDAKISALQIPGGRNITGTISAKSKALSLDVVLDGHLALSPEVISTSQFLTYEDAKLGSRSIGQYTKLAKDKFFVIVKLPSAVLLMINSNLKISRDVQSFDSTYQTYSLSPAVVQGEIKDWNSVMISVFRKDKPDSKLLVKGGFAWGQVAEIRASLQGSDKKTDLFHVTVALDESHFLQTDYGGSLDEVKKVIEFARSDASKFARQAKIAVADSVLEANNEVRGIAEQMQKAKPNLKPLLESYQKELKAMTDELANEKLAKEITEFIKNIVARISAFLEKISAELHKYVEILEKPLKDLSDAIKKLVAVVSEKYAHLAESAVAHFDQLVKAAGQYMSKIVEFLRKYEDELKKVATIVGQGVQDIGRIVSKALGQIRHEIEDFVKVFMEQLKALPIYEVLKERYQELKKYQIPEQTWSVIHEMIGAFIGSMPTEELSEFLESISKYVEKHLKREKVDDMAELKKISENAIKAVKSIIQLIRTQISNSELDKLLKFTAVPLPGSSWFQLPIFAPIHFSPLKWLQSGDLPSLSEYYYTYRPTLNPLDWVPPYKMYGILVDSHNFYTFDRKYYNFKGACSYVLAQDFVDGNFSLIVNLEGGKFKSILLNDAKDSIELLSDMSILVNGKPQDFPALQGDLSAWRRYESANIRSRAGVFVTCDMQHQVCQFFVSGFYFGRTRGLLGNMNYEQFDDMTMPSGKIASKISEFGNSWKVNAECSDVANVEHDHSKESHAECTRFFSGSSPLSSCFPYVNPAAFRTACEHAATEAKSDDLKKKAACNLAFAYTQSCQYDRIKVDLPSSCATCSSGKTNVAIGDSVSVKSPQTQADIVLVVEQITPNEEVFKELIAPLISTLSNDLKAKGITDVHFSLLGFGAPDQKWPSHFTSGGDLSFEGKTKNIWFGAPSTVEKSLDTTEKKLKWVKHQIDIETGNLRVIDALHEAHDFPFRATAVKSIIGVMGQPCESSFLPISVQQVRSYIGSYVSRSEGISVHMITPLSDLSLDNDKPSDEIVGFDSEHVYTLEDAKKKPLEGSTELRSHLKHDFDNCIKYALGTYGSAFSSKNFLSAKPGQRKQFVSVLSQRVTDSLAGGEIHQDCKCSLYDGLHPKMTCKVTSRTEHKHG